MSINVYELEERISFDPERPCGYYGWFVSTSGASDQAAMFATTADREGFASWVKDLTGNDDWRLAGLLLCAYVSEGGTAYWVLQESLTNGDEFFISAEHQGQITDELEAYHNPNGEPYTWGLATHEIEQDES